MAYPLSLRGAFVAMKQSPTYEEIASPYRARNDMACYLGGSTYQL